MKKIVLLICVFIPALARAQYGAEFLTSPSSNVYIFLGTLPADNVGNYEKIKVDIFGGGWASNTTGQTTYYIANRAGLVINQVTMGAFSNNQYALHAYTNSSGGIDFYLLTAYYASIAVRSCMIGGPATTLISNTSSASVPAGVEITPLPITPVFITDQNGNIGIGTATSAYPLQVGSSIWNNLGSNFALAVAGDVAIGSAVSGSQSKLSIYEGTGGAAFQLKKHNGYTEFSDSQGILNLNGNVGIGTTNPQYILHIVGNNPDRADFAIENTSSTPVATATRALTQILTTGPTGYGISGWTNASVLESSGIGGLVLDAYGSNTPIVFQTNRVEQMRITPSGSLVIGATNPQGYKLAVAGDAIAESMTVKAQADWPDYIFTKNYTMMPLAQVKSYVDKNQHLPEIPSAAEVEKNGVNLGEMNKLLLKKVEELTLYMIDKDKQVGDLKEQLQLQRATLKKMQQQIEALSKGRK